MEKIDWKQLAEQYEYEAKAFSIVYDEILEKQRAFIVFGGIIAKMRSECLEYESKNGKGKTEAQNKRITDLIAVYQKLSGISEHNQRLKTLLSRTLNRVDELESENEKFKKELLANEKAFNQE